MILNHLAQSTVFGVFAGLLTLAFRRNGANVRFSLWLAASIKFLIPFSLLVDAGAHFAWRVPSALSGAGLPDLIYSVGQQVSQPFPGRVPISHGHGAMSLSMEWAPTALWIVWAIGFVAVLSSWWRRSRVLRAALRTASPVDLAQDIQVLTSPAFAEPGVYGIRRPVLLLPAGIIEELPASQLDAILAHEMCHVRRRDNLATALHMAVEAIFWFHPLVWWLGARLMEERERACDEEVLRGGSRPEVYAEGILKICEMYLESPLRSVAGVTGGNLKRRIEEIMAHGKVSALNLPGKVALVSAAVAALTLPVLTGMLGASAARGQYLPTTAATPRFDVTSVKACKGDVPQAIRIGGGISPGRLSLNCLTVVSLIRQAYYLFANGRLDPPGMVPPIEGGPGWVNTDLYTIEAKPVGAPGEGIMRGPMTRALLEDRFQLKVHRETREVPVYVLTTAKGELKLQPAAAGGCKPVDLDTPFTPPPPGRTLVPICRMSAIQRDALDIYGASMADLAAALSGRRLERSVIDRTGLSGTYDFHLHFAPGSGVALPPPPPPVPGADPAAAPPPVDPADILLAIQSELQKIGLKLESAKGPGEFLVIDSVQRPTEN